MKAHYKPSFRPDVIFMRQNHTLCGRCYAFICLTTRGILWVMYWVYERLSFTFLVEFLLCGRKTWLFEARIIIWQYISVQCFPNTLKGIALFASSQASQACTWNESGKQVTMGVVYCWGGNKSMFAENGLSQCHILYDISYGLPGIEPCSPQWEAND